MSDNRFAYAARLAVIGLVGLLIGKPACAWGVPDGLNDPLLALPPALAQGPRLPDDNRPSVCPATVDLTQPLSLPQALDVGLCNNAQIKAAWAAIKLQAASVGQARAAYWPNASVSVAQQNSHTQYPGYVSADTTAVGHTVNAGITWRLFDFGQRSANAQAANLALDAALANQDATLQKVMSAIVGAYFDAQTNNAVVEARQAAVSLAQHTYETTVRRQQHGAAARSDSLQAATALAKTNMALSRAQTDAQSARATLLYALGIAPSTALTLAALTQHESDEPLDDLRDWLDDVGVTHPAIVAAQAQWAAAQAKVTATRAEGLPTLDATSNFYQNGYPNQGVQTLRSNVTTIGVTLTIPLFEGFARTYKIREAQAQAQQSEAQLLDTTQQVLTDLIKAHAAAISAARNLETSASLLASAQEALAVSQRRYEKGATDILELLSVQSALVDAQQERVRSLGDWESARLRLMAAAGKLGWQDK